MDDIKRLLFNQQKFQILATAKNPAMQGMLSGAYVYAWDNNIYPIKEEGVTWHKGYEDCFSVDAEAMGELLKFLDERWLEKNPITFYELEDHYDVSGVRSGAVWDRGDLISACRYFYLHRLFDTAFWDHMVGAANGPVESHGIRHNFDLAEIYLQ